MALQASGPISFYDIKEEFGLPLGKNLGAYRISQSVAGLSNLALDNEVNNVGIITAIMPQSGTIRFSDFYNKRLNIVVNCGSGSRITARSRYDDNIGIATIGGFTRRPDSSAGRKVWIHTNETIRSNIAASSAPNREYSSLITGGWESNTNLRLDIGPDGIVSGAGGNGGAGGNIGYLSCGSGQAGRFGTSAIGVDHQPIIITNRGRIQGGGGGGGGGGSAFAHNHRSRGRSVWSLAAGGGGGGGLGSPGGSGGRAGSGTGGNRSGTVRNAAAGGSGSLFSGGGGGVGAYQDGSLAVAEGGSGGSAGNGGASGRIVSAANDRCSSPGGGAGAPGFGIIITNNGTGVSITNSGTLIGGVVYSTSVS